MEESQDGIPPVTETTVSSAAPMPLGEVPFASAPLAPQQVPSLAVPLPVPPVQKELKKPTGLMKFIRVLGPVVILIFIVGLTSTNASVVNLASQGVGLLGALFALLFGIYAARRMLYNIRSNEQTGNRISKLLAISMLVMVVGFGLSSVVGGSLFGNGLLGLGTPVRGLLGLIGPIVFIVSLHRTDVDPRGGPRHYKTISKVCLVLLGFLGGILPALILAATGYFILWSRWCQLTNSKCL